MNVLSLFDGISCSRIALENVGFKVNNYFSSEIDSTCIEISKKNFPDNIFLGDVKNIDVKKLPKIDLLIGGSPCQDLSLAFKGAGLKGSRSSLFFEFVRLRDAIKPDYFLLENVKNKYKKQMDHEIGIHGVEINSMHFSAQSRPRCYWTNIPVDMNLPENRLTISDIIEDRVDKRYYLSQEIYKAVRCTLPKKIDKDYYFGIKKLSLISRDLIKDNERQRRLYSIYGKAPTILARSDTPKILIRNGIRKLTPIECERLQKIPDNFTEGVSDSKRYKMIGNGFTVSVIEHILKNITDSKPTQMNLYL